MYNFEKILTANSSTSCEYNPNVKQSLSVLANTNPSGTKNNWIDNARFRRPSILIENRIHIMVEQRISNEHLYRHLTAFVGNNKFLSTIKYSPTDGAAIEIDFKFVLIFVDNFNSYLHTMWKKYN